MDKRTIRMTAALFAGSCLTLVVLAGCSSANRRAQARAEQTEADLNAPVAQSGVNLQRYRIKDWAVPNDHTIIIVDDKGARYRAQTLGPCQGLDFSQRLGFVTRGAFNQIDRFSSVRLDDGTSCPLTSFDKLKSAESKALDDYEKSGDAGEKKDSGAKPK